MKKLYTILLILLFATPAWSATTYYVRTDGHNTNCAGTHNASDASTETNQCAWLTIQKCADTMVAGDTCIVAAGTYNEQVTETTDGTYGVDELPFTADDQFITYVSNPHTNPSAETPGGAITRGFVVTNRKYIRIIGFQFTHLTDAYTHGISAEKASYCQFNLNYAHHVYGNGVYLYGTTASNNLVRGNKVEYLWCPASGPCGGGSPFILRGAKNLFEYNYMAHVNDYFAISTPAAENGYNIIRNNFLGACYFKDNGMSGTAAEVDNTHTDGEEECTGPGTAHDSTGDYLASCCTGAGVGVTCSARHIDEVQTNTLSNYILFEKNYHDYGADTDITDRHGMIARLTGGLGMKLRENLWNRVLAAWYSNGSGFRQYNNTTVNSKANSTVALLYGSSGTTLDGKSFNNVYYNATAATNNWPYAIYVKSPVSELIADYDIWYGYTAYYASSYQTPTPWDGSTRAAITATANNPLLEALFDIPSNSPAKGAGVSLTLANGAAAEATQTLVVDDAKLFIGQDWGVLQADGSLYGDTIIIGTNDPVVIEAVNYSTNTITLASAQTWADNATVRLSHQNASMDMGAYPYRATTYSLTGSWVLADGTVTVTPSDATLVRFVEVFEDGVPKGVDFTSPYEVAGIGAGTVTAKIYSLYASATPVINATEGAGTYYQVTPSVVSGCGTISPTVGEYIISGGDSSTYTGTPCNGWKVSAWSDVSGSCGASGSQTTKQLTNVTGACGLGVTFEQIKLMGWVQ